MFTRAPRVLIKWYHCLRGGIGSTGRGPRGKGLRLFKLLEEKTEPEKAELGFRVLYRLMRDKPGRPNYPLFSWDLLHNFVDYYRESS